LSSDTDSVTSDLNDVLQEVISDFDYLITEKKAEITIGVMPVIKGVPSQLRQVFQNLIGNSMKFTRSDVAPQIEITSEIIATKEYDSEPLPTGKYCRIIVKDNGIGFEEVYIDKIFKIFQSLHSSNQFEGTGIGLAIVKKIIEKHNGIITAKSSLGNGASFIIILPL
jgi:signal transduction histidine kinase